MKFPPNIPFCLVDEKFFLRANPELLLNKSKLKEDIFFIYKAGRLNLDDKNNINELFLNNNTTIMISVILNLIRE